MRLSESKFHVPSFGDSHSETPHPPALQLVLS